VLSVGVEFGLIFWGADFLVSAGLSASAAATTVSLFLWGMVAGRITGRQIARRMTAERLVPLALGAATVGFLLYWLAPAVAVVVIGLFIAGFGVANLYPLTTALAIGAAPGRTDAAGARLSLASGTAILCAPLLLGALADAVGIERAYAVVPVFLTGAFFAVHLGRQGTSPAGETIASGGAKSA
jgi:fucose permease